MGPGQGLAKAVTRRESAPCRGVAHAPCCRSDRKRSTSQAPIASRAGASPCLVESCSVAGLGRDPPDRRHGGDRRDSARWLVRNLYDQPEHAPGVLRSGDPDRHGARWLDPLVGNHGSRLGTRGRGLRRPRRLVLVACRVDRCRGAVREWNAVGALWARFRSLRGHHRVRSVHARTFGLALGLRGRGTVRVEFAPDMFICAIGVVPPQASVAEVALILHVGTPVPTQCTTWGGSRSSTRR